MTLTERLLHILPGNKRKEHLSISTTGVVTINPSELLRSEEGQKQLEALKKLKDELKTA
jgi:hypothetical protein